jgi:hypothetical protein
MPLPRPAVASAATLPLPQPQPASEDDGCTVHISLQMQMAPGTRHPSWCDRAPAGIGMLRYWATVFDIVRGELQCYDDFKVRGFIDCASYNGDTDSCAMVSCAPRGAAPAPPCWPGRAAQRGA